MEHSDMLPPAKASTVPLSGPLADQQAQTDYINSLILDIDRTKTLEQLKADLIYPAHMTTDDLGKFRTKVCEKRKRQAPCELNNFCPYSHCLSWQRRDPYQNSYQADQCGDLKYSKTSSGLKATNSCKKRRACGYAHTKEEHLYHPSHYKVQLCKKFPQCDKYFCPFAHGEDELRGPEYSAEIRLSRQFEFRDPSMHTPSKHEERSQPTLFDCTVERTGVESQHAPSELYGSLADESRYPHSDVGYAPQYPTEEATSQYCFPQAAVMNKTWRQMNSNCHDLFSNGNLVANEPPAWIRYANCLQPLSENLTIAHGQQRYHHTFNQKQDHSRITIDFDIPTSLLMEAVENTSGREKVVELKSLLENALSRGGDGFQMRVIPPSQFHPGMAGMEFENPNVFVASSVAPLQSYYMNM